MTDFSSSAELDCQALAPNFWQSDAILVKDLCIVRGDMTLSVPLTFNVQSGQILHIQGHNGVGKTTLMMMLAGLLPVANKTAMTWMGVKSTEWPILYIGHKIGLTTLLSVRQNLEFLQSLNSNALTHIEDALGAVGLTGYEDVPIAQLSSGQKRRVALARLWLTSDPGELWLLDEPLTALDQTMVERLGHQLLKHVERGGRVILTSHQPLEISCGILDLSEYSVPSLLDDESFLWVEDQV